MPPKENNWNKGKRKQASELAIKLKQPAINSYIDNIIELHLLYHFTDAKNIAKIKK